MMDARDGLWYAQSVNSDPRLPISLQLGSTPTDPQSVWFGSHSQSCHGHPGPGVCCEWTAKQIDRSLWLGIGCAHGPTLSNLPSLLKGTPTQKKTSVAHDLGVHQGPE